MLLIKYKFQVPRQVQVQVIKVGCVPTYLSGMVHQFLLVKGYSQRCCNNLEIKITRCLTQKQRSVREKFYLKFLMSSVGAQSKAVEVAHDSINTNQRVVFKRNKGDGILVFSFLNPFLLEKLIDFTEDMQDSENLQV